jgi:hypothetical protein
LFALAFPCYPLDCIFDYDFRVEQFTGYRAAVTLYAEISRDYNVRFERPPDAVGRLNRVLRAPNFYDLWASKVKSEKEKVTEKPKGLGTKNVAAQPPEMTEEMKRLVAITKNDRTADFFTLAAEPQANIVRLNRRVLEAAYPKLCPKLR